MPASAAYPGSGLVVLGLRGLQTRAMEAESSLARASTAHPDLRAPSAQPAADKTAALAGVVLYSCTHIRKPLTLEPHSSAAGDVLEAHKADTLMAVRYGVT